MTQSEERAARNEISFREANERLSDKRVELELDGLTPFLCECGNSRCMELVRLTLDEYEHVRSRPTWFLVVVGHDAGAGATAEEHGGYTIVEKSGVAGGLAEDDYSRSD